MHTFAHAVSLSCIATCTQGGCHCLFYDINARGLLPTNVNNVPAYVECKKDLVLSVGYLFIIYINQTFLSVKCLWQVDQSTIVKKSLCLWFQVLKMSFTIINLSYISVIQMKIGNQLKTTLIIKYDYIIFNILSRMNTFVWK